MINSWKVRYMDFKEDLVSIRKSLGWSQQKLAEKMFVSQNTVSQYETGVRAITAEMYLFMLSVMGVSIQYVYENEKGEKINMESTKREVPTEPIDYRAIGSGEGFRLWALQNNPDTLRIEITRYMNEYEHFVVYKNGDADASFWLYLDTINVNELIQICREENISFEEL